MGETLPPSANGQTGYMDIGPAHRGHPDYLKYYTEDGVPRDYPDAKHYRLKSVGYGADAELTIVPKLAETEIPE